MTTWERASCNAKKLPSGHFLSLRAVVYKYQAWSESRHVVAPSLTPHADQDMPGGTKLGGRTAGAARDERRNPIASGFRKQKRKHAPFRSIEPDRDVAH
jgi:hypothetical protein